MSFFVNKFIIFFNLFKKCNKGVIIILEDICMELNEILNIYVELEKKVNDLWRSL